ncbi:CsrA RNA-binding global regulator CsrA [uncultured Caudovirales phage]|uniref:CsrA RNA-binding global regulator CsrA n=1 Tax=uncultured Caudovirales phage TaxID=2100421 RepID=A0A6J5QBD3_9CAUD|nr:CsrA RNA-binding global regulator CsrA [uncultured Caudovirales phage]CAB4219702.1 CsrA RNA-binding global regulator CsrA [uncultured Caudovirales phage]
MLVLSRKQGEVIMVGNTAITIVRICKDRVRVGITAPPEVAVDRLEVREAKQRKTEIQQQQEQGK